jgi:hypothetical protein
MTNDDRAKELIESEIRKAWPDIVQSVSVTPRIDFLDEAAFDVLVGLKSVDQVPESIPRGDIIARLDAALKESGDERTTHLSFSAPDEVFDADEAENAEGVSR